MINKPNITPPKGPFAQLALGWIDRMDGWEKAARWAEEHGSSLEAVRMRARREALEEALGEVRDAYEITLENQYGEIVAPPLASEQTSVSPDASAFFVQTSQSPDSFSPASEIEILAAAETIIKKVIPPPQNAMQMVDQAMQCHTLLKALAFVAILENDRAVKQAKETEKIGKSEAAHGSWDTCFEFLFAEVMKRYPAEPKNAWDTRFAELRGSYEDLINPNTFEDNLIILAEGASARMTDLASEIEKLKQVVRLSYAWAKRKEHWQQARDVLRSQMQAMGELEETEDVPPMPPSKTRWGVTSTLEWLRGFAKRSRKPGVGQELQAMHLDDAALNLELAAKEAEELENRLDGIADVIRSVDNLAMAVDGPVTPTHQALGKGEITTIWHLASGKKPDAE